MAEEVDEEEEQQLSRGSSSRARCGDEIERTYDGDREEKREEDEDSGRTGRSRRRRKARGWKGGGRE